MYHGILKQMNQEHTNKPKKVLFVITKSNWGGAQKYIFDIATNLPSEFEPIVALGGNGLLKQRLEAKRIAVEPIFGMQRNIALLKELIAFFHLLYLLSWKIKPDVVHLNSSKAAALGALAARITQRKKIVFTVHGWPFKENRGTLARAAIYSISWLTAVMSHEVIVVSKSDEVQGKKMPGGVADKIHYISIGTGAPQFLPRDEAMAALSIGTKNPGVVTIAELTRNKGIRYAIEAVSLLKNRGITVSYFIIGNGEERRNLEILGREKGVSDRVQFLGFVEDAARYLKAFDVFLLPSVKEGMPYVLFEAVSAELRVITTAVVDPAVLEVFKGLIKVEPENPAQIADAIETSLHPNTKKWTVEKQFGFPLSRMVAQTIALY